VLCGVEREDVSTTAATADGIYVGKKKGVHYYYTHTSVFTRGERRMNVNVC
jgi:hypothetical protein